MKKFYTFIILFSVAVSSKAQWTTSGTTITGQVATAGTLTVDLKAVTTGSSILSLSPNTGGIGVIKVNNFGATANPLTFQTNSLERMRIDATGNVGIGTTSPNQKLTVNGTIYGKEVKVDLNVPGPDYVFEKDYHLMSLEETKAYIDANKHLPEVPSAAAMEKNGVQLGEMNMLLLKKIEELTLYLLKMNEENRLLKIENDKQNEAIEFLKSKIK